VALAYGLRDDPLYREISRRMCRVAASNEGLRSVLRRYEPELWAALLGRALRGGRGSGGAERAVLAALYGWGVSGPESDVETVARMRRAMEMVEDSQALTAEQLFTASLRFIARYLRAHPEPEAWAELWAALPARALELAAGNGSNGQS
jgi:hypothetical protein